MGSQGDRKGRRAYKSRPYIINRAPTKMTIMPRHWFNLISASLKRAVQLYTLYTLRLLDYVCL